MQGHHKNGYQGHHKNGYQGYQKKECFKYAGIFYAITLFVHMCNLRCYFHKLSAWETKRIEAGEVLSDDGWGCGGPWRKKHWKKKHEQRRANQTESLDSSSTQMN